jgi:hypothetical protein
LENSVPKKAKFSEEGKRFDPCSLAYEEFPLWGINCIPKILVICDETKII